MRRFYAPVNSFTKAGVTLNEDETRHLRDVLRLRIGSDVSVFDGMGREFMATISLIGKRSSELGIFKEIEPASAESPLDLTIAAAVISGEKYDLMVQKAVELGVNKLIPLITMRCDMKVKDAARRLERWRRIAMEATKQCGRAKLMRITEPLGFAELIANSIAKDVVVFSERDGLNFSSIKPDKRITALLGPKGGWDNTELDAAVEQGIKIVTLGGRILRAETAAIGITAILQHRFGDIN